MQKQDRMVVVDGRNIHVDFNEDRRPDRALSLIIKVILVAYVATWGFQWMAQHLHMGFLQPVADLLWNNGVLDKTVYGGQVWRFVTHMFLHAGFWHIFGNTLALVSFALFARNCFSGRGWLLVYFGGGLTAALLQLSVTPDQQMVGASGGIMAIWGATIAATIRFRWAPAAERPWEHVVPLRTSLFWLVFQFVFEQFIANVGHWAHLGGLLGGLVIGSFLALRGAPAILSSRTGVVGINFLHLAQTRDKRSYVQKLTLALRDTFDAARDFIVVEWEHIDMFNRRHFAYEVIAGKAPDKGILSRGALVELANPYRADVLQDPGVAEALSAENIKIDDSMLKALGLKLKAKSK